MDSADVESRKRKQIQKDAESKKRKDMVPFATGYKQATASSQIKAIGCDPMSREYDPALENSFCFFKPIPQPISISDWLAQYDEDGQTYRQFLRECPWISARKRKYMRQVFNPKGKSLRDRYPEGKIYLLPLGEFDGKNSVDFQDLVDYTEAYIGIPTQSLPAIKLEVSSSNAFWVEEPKDELKTPQSSRRVSSRTKRQSLNFRYDRSTKHTQLKIDSGLLQMRQIIPDDAICVIGLTMYDLYCDQSDLFVVGMAAGNHRVAIFSFYRYNPGLTFSHEFWFDIKQIKLKITDAEKKRLILQRSCKLVVHEINHLLGLDHCVFFDCCMNGSGHLEEDYRQPMHLCPVDLHKLQVLIGFDVVERYSKLFAFCEKHNLKVEADWIQKRIDFIRNNQSV